MIPALRMFKYNSNANMQRAAFVPIVVKSPGLNRSMTRKNGFVLFRIGLEGGSVTVVSIVGSFLAEGLVMLATWPLAATTKRASKVSLATLLPSASCSLNHSVSASARLEPSQPFRISRYMLAIPMNYFIA